VPTAGDILRGVTSGNAPLRVPRFAEGVKGHYTQCQQCAQQIPHGGSVWWCWFDIGVQGLRDAEKFPVCAECVEALHEQVAWEKIAEAAEPRVRRR